MSQEQPKPRMMPLYILIALNRVSMTVTWLVINPLVMGDNKLLVSSGYGVGAALLEINPDNQSVKRL